MWPVAGTEGGGEAEGKHGAALLDACPVRPARAVVGVWQPAGSRVGGGKTPAKRTPEEVQCFAGERS